MSIDLHVEVARLEHEWRKMLGRACIAEAMLDKVIAERDALRAALSDAIYEVEDWAGYASDYFRNKHDLKGTLERLRASLKGQP